MVRPQSSVGKKILFLLVLSALVALFCFASLEIVLRIVSPPNLFTPLLPLRPHIKLELHPQLRGISPTARHTTNRWGFRGDEPPLQRWGPVTTIVTVGGSTTLCFYLDDAKTWPYLLQEKLKAAGREAWVGNGGLDGQSTRAHLIFAEKVIPRIRPDVVVFLTGINDLGFSISEPVRVLGNSYDKKDVWGNRIKPFLFNSRVIQVLYTWKLILWDRVEVVTTSPHHDYTPRLIQGAPDSVPDDVRPLLPGLPEYRENIRRLIRLTRSAGARPVFLTQPSLFEATPYWQVRDGGLYWLRNLKARVSGATMRRFLDAYNRTLLEVCAEEKADCYDLASDLRSGPDIFYDTMHLTEKGADRVAELTAAFLDRVLTDGAGA